MFIIIVIDCLYSVIDVIFLECLNKYLPRENGIFRLRTCVAFVSYTVIEFDWVAIVVVVVVLAQQLLVLCGGCHLLHRIDEAQPTQRGRK